MSHFKYEYHPDCDWMIFTLMEFYAWKLSARKSEMGSYWNMVSSSSVPLQFLQQTPSLRRSPSTWLQREKKTTGRGSPTEDFGSQI